MYDNKYLNMSNSFLIYDTGAIKMSSINKISYLNENDCYKLLINNIIVVRLNKNEYSELDVKNYIKEIVQHIEFNNQKDFFISDMIKHKYVYINEKYEKHEI